MSERFVVKSHKRNDGIWWYVCDTHRNPNRASKLYKNRGEALGVMYDKNARFG